MLADEDHPLEDAIAAPAPPDPKLVVVYRTRGVPWLLVPPLLLLAGVAAIVVYRRSERPEPFPRTVATVVPTSSSNAAVGETSGPVQDGRVRIDGLTELAELTGRPVAPRAAPVGNEGQRFDPTPPAAPTPEPKPVVAEAKPPAPVPAPKENPKPADPPAVAPAPAPAPTIVNAPPLAPPAGKPDVPKASGSSPFDPVVASVEKPAPTPPPVAVAPKPPPAIGFDPDAARALVAAEPTPVTERPAPEAAPEPARAVAPPRNEQPLALDPRQPNGAARPVDPKRAQRTMEAQLDAQAEAERRLAQRLHLEEIMPALLDVSPAERTRKREEFATYVRRLAARDRAPFHEALRRAIREFGREAGPEITAIREQFGVDCLPEIAEPANRDLTGPAARLTLEQRIERMRRWGLPETWILDDIYAREHGNLKGRDGAHNDDEAWIFAARVLLAHPPPVPRSPGPPAMIAAPSR